MNKKQNETDWEELRKILKESAVKAFEVVPVNVEPKEFLERIPAFKLEKDGSLKEYFYKKFNGQRRLVTNRHKATDENGETVLVFGKNHWRNFEKDMRFVPEEDRAKFLLSLFMIIMTDQALYTYEKDLYPIWHEAKRTPKFGGNGFGLYNEPPFWILAKADNDKNLCEKAIALMPEFATFLIKETEKNFVKLFKDKIDIKAYFSAILNNSAYRISSQEPDAQELRDSKTVASFKQCFEAELKNKNLI